MRKVRPVVWLLAAVLLGGCVCCPIGAIGPSPDLVEADLVGTYRGPGEATVTLAADGTFTAAGLDAEECRHDGEPVAVAGGTGTWELHGPETLDPYQRLDMDFDAPEPYGWYGWLADEDELLFHIGDPDAYRFCFLSRD